MAAKKTQKKAAASKKSAAPKKKKSAAPKKKKSAAPKVVPTAAATPASTTSPIRGLQHHRIPRPAKKHGMFFREGALSWTGGNRAAWANMGLKRVGWLDLAEGSFTELFACNPYARSVGADATAAVGSMKELLVICEGKKPVRYPAGVEACAHISVFGDRVFTVQTKKKTHDDALHVWNRASFRLEKVVAVDVGKFSWLGLSGALVHTVNNEAEVELWHDWRSGPHVVELPALKRDAYGRTVHGVGVSSDGQRGAVVTAKEILVFDRSGAMARVAAPPAAGSLEGEPVRMDHASQTWVHPLPHARVVVVDFCRRGSHYDAKTDASFDRQEVVVDLYDVAANKKLASENVVFRADTDHGIAEHIAICDEGVLLNCERLVRFTT